MANETTTTTTASTIPTEIITSGMRMYPRLRPAALSVAWQEPGQGNVPINFQRLATASIIPAGTKTEAASFTRVVHSTASTAVTPAFVGGEIAITDETMMSTQNKGIKSVFATDRARALMVRMSTDLMANITGSTNTYGDTATDLSRDTLMLAIVDYWALNLGDASMHSILLSNAAAGQLGQDTIATSATTAEMRNQFGMNLLLGEFQGFAVLRAAEAPAEGVGFSSCITPVGNVASGLLLGVSESITLRPPQRGAEGERDAEEYAVIRAMYGTADDDDYYLELQTAA